MDLDSTELAKFVAEAIDAIEDGYDDLPGIKNIEIGTAMLISEVKVTYEDEDGEEHDATSIFYRCSDGRVWVQLGLLRAAVVGTESQPDVL